MTRIDLPRLSLGSNCDPDVRLGQRGPRPANSPSHWQRHGGGDRGACGRLRARTKPISTPRPRTSSCPACCRTRIFSRARPDPCASLRSSSRSRAAGTSNYGFQMGVSDGACELVPTDTIPLWTAASVGAEYVVVIGNLPTQSDARFLGRSPTCLYGPSGVKMLEHEFGHMLASSGTSSSLKRTAPPRSRIRFLLATRATARGDRRVGAHPASLDARSTTP